MLSQEKSVLNIYYFFAMLTGEKTLSCRIKLWVNLWYCHITPCLLAFYFTLTIEMLYVVPMKCQLQGEFWHWDTWHGCSSNTLCHWHFIPAMNCNDSFIIQGRFTLSTSSVIHCAKCIWGINPLTWLELHVKRSLAL